MFLALILSTLLQTAEPGDYLVTCQNRVSTVLLVDNVDGNQITMEEISTRGKPQDISWRQWVECGAPRHTSWTRYTLNSKTGETSNTYSYTQKGWVKEAQKEQFLRTLLSIDFKKIPEGERKKIGPTPRPGRADTRRTWNPSLVFEGRTYKELPFDAYHARWPRDGSQLAGREVTIYTPAIEGPYPNHFPYWIEIYPAPGDNKIRVTDSGRAMQSPKS